MTQDTERTGAAADEAMDARLRKALADPARRAEALLVEACANFDGPEPLPEAMRYAVLGVGKRLRPIMVLASCRAAGGPVETAAPAAAAIEFVHAYSLVHDDLPAMDDDALRRGRPTVHVVYGEANAILVGDALQTAAFAAISDSDVLGDGQKARCVSALAAGAGSTGMVGGQVDDIAMTAADEDGLLRMHAAKTGALFVTACRMGAICAGASPSVEGRLAEFAAAFGEAFQVADDLVDLLDLDPEDHHEAQVNLAVVAGPRRAVDRVAAACERAYAALKELDGDTETLTALIDWVSARAADAARRYGA